MKTLITRSFVVVFGILVLVSAASAQGINLGVNAKAGIEVQQSAGLAENSTSAAVETNTTAEAEGIVLQRGSFEATSTAHTSIAVGLISSIDDLETYAEASMRSDEHIQAMESSAESVSMAYDSNAKLFGFIPVVVVVRAEIDKEGEVTTHYPWYSFLLRKDNAAVETALSSAAKATIEADASAGSGMTPRLQGTLLAELHAVLKTAFNS